MSKYSVGIYSTEPVDWRTDRSEELKQEIAALPTIPVTRNPDGTATIETYSVRYDWPIRTGIIVGRLDSDNSRFMATTEDEDLVALMSDDDPLGAAISVWSTENGNRASFA
jgi:acetyl-CoA C-acetyltransferase